MTIMQLILLSEHENDFYPKEEEGRLLAKKKKKKLNKEARCQFAFIYKSSIQDPEMCLCLDLL